MNHYRLTLRPASIGCYPACDDDGNPLTPTVTETHWPPVRTPDGRNHYATVAYATPLTFDQVWHYDLQPVDAVEAARYFVWHHYDRQQTLVDQYLPQWLRMARADLHRVADDGSAIAAAALVLQAAAGSQP